VIPLNLFDNLNEVIADLPVQNRQKVQEALNTFSDDDRTSEWLLSF